MDNNHLNKQNAERLQPEFTWGERELEEPDTDEKSVRAGETRGAAGAGGRTRL